MSSVGHRVINATVILIGVEALTLLTDVVVEDIGAVIWHRQQ